MSSLAVVLNPKSQPIVGNRAAIADIVVRGLFLSPFLNSLHFVTPALI
jgi:hypothetical protein